MAHFAKLDENNIVTDVVVVNNEVIDDNGVESEAKGVEFLRTLFKEPTANWKQTSYNKTIRANFAGPGFTYDPSNDVFVGIKPSGFDSWGLNTSTWMYEAPVAHPNDARSYTWNEGNGSWDLVPGSVADPDYTFDEASQKWVKSS